MTPIDLMPPQVRQRINAHRAVQRWAMLLAGLTPLLGVLVPISRLSLDESDPALIERHDDAVSLRDQAERERAEVAQQASALDQAASMRELATRHPDWSVLLRAVAGTRGQDVRLASVRLSSDTVTPPVARGAETPNARSTSPATPSQASPETTAPVAQVKTPTDMLVLQLEGVARSSGSVFEFAQRLEQLGVFDRVRIDDTRPGGAIAGSVQFTINATTVGERKEPPR